MWIRGTDLDKTHTPFHRKEPASRFVWFDLAGTLSDHSARRREQKRTGDWHAYFRDLPSDPVRQIGKAVWELFDDPLWIRCVWTGEPDQYETETRAWLRSHGFIAKHLLMRPRGLTMPNPALKAELMERMPAMLAPYDVFVEDDTSTIDALRERNVASIIALPPSGTPWSFGPLPPHVDAWVTDNVVEATR